MRRAAMHGAVSGEERARIFSRYYSVYHEAGRLAEAYLRMAQTYAASGYFRNAATLLRRAEERVDSAAAALREARFRRDVPRGVEKRGAGVKTRRATAGRAARRSHPLPIPSLPRPTPSTAFALRPTRAPDPAGAPARAPLASDH